MKFLDQAKIYIRAGNGGAGCVSFRREAHIEKGGPDGGDGGAGGSIYAECVDGLNTLIDYRYRQHFKGGTGGHGMGKNRTGAAGSDKILPVPIGTQIFAEDNKTLIADMTHIGQRVCLAKGGAGGFGNTRFKGPVNQTPRRANAGQSGAETWLWLRLKLIADIGLIGLPNAGKSSFLAASSRARPKIADYPFTTLHPHLGVAGGTTFGKGGQEFIIADIPGLISGASQGAGLGHRFLGHVERCPLLLHLIDGTQANIAHAWQTVRHELTAYGHGLADKTEIIALNKADIMDDGQIKDRQAELQALCGQKVSVFSALTGNGLDALLMRIQTYIDNERMAQNEAIAQAGWQP